LLKEKIKCKTDSTIIIQTNKCYKSRGFKYALLNESFSIRQENTGATNARGFKYALLNESLSIRQENQKKNYLIRREERKRRGNQRYILAEKREERS